MMFTIAGADDMTGHQQLDCQIDDLVTTLHMLAFEISAGRETRPAVVATVSSLKDAIREVQGWQSISTAPTDRPVIVWDEYYLMRIARFDHSKNQWVQDLPYGDDPGRGEVEKPLEPMLWQPCPRLPEHVSTRSAFQS